MLLPPDVLIEARERARIVAWLMLYRARARRNIASPELVGTVEAVVGVLIEQIATGAHSTLDVDLGDRPGSVH